MTSPAAPFDFRALLQCRVTTTVLVSSLTLSLLHLQGSDMSALFVDAATWKTQPWRLVTSTLLHADFVHLALNLYWTAVFGVIVEKAFGGWATAGLMLFLALVSSAPQAALSGPGIGLSGVGYGLFGFLWTLNRWDARYRGCLHPQTTKLFVVWFFFCILLTVTDAMPIGNVAHGAGALVGAAIGWSVAKSSRAPAARFLPLFLVLSAVVLSCTVLQPVLASRKAQASAMSRAGHRALEAGDHLRAEPLLAGAAEADPDDWRVWWWLGMARWQLGRHDEALIALERAARLHALEPEYAKFLSEARAWREYTKGRPGASK